MSSKRDLLKGKNKELSEKRRPPLQYVDFKDLLVFTKEDLDREMEKLPDLKLRKDDESILHRRSSTGNLRSMASHESLFSVSTELGGNHDYTGSLNRKRSRSTSILSISRPCSSMSFRSFFEMSKSPFSKTDVYEEEIFPYESPIPAGLRHLKMKDLIHTDIDWKMLTLSRPTKKQDIEFFSRLVELNKLHHKTKLEDGYGFRRAAFNVTRHPLVLRYNRMRALSDDMDALNIEGDFDYDSYAWYTPEVDPMVQQQYENEMLEQVTKLMDDNFGSNFTIKDDEKDKKRTRRTPSPRPPSRSEGSTRQAKPDDQKQSGNVVSSSTGAIPKNKRKKERSAVEPALAMETDSKLSNSKRGRSKVRAPEIVVTPMQNK